MKTKYYWTKETENVALEWIKTRDDVLFATKLYQPLKYMAMSIVGKIKRHTKNDEDTQNVLTHLVHSLPTFKVSKGIPMYQYLYKVGKNYLLREYKTSVALKRDYRLTVELPPTTKDNEQYIESIFAYRPIKQDKYHDTQFVEMMLNYWERNANKHFKSRRLETCLLIIDILRRPHKYPCDGPSYVGQIKDKVGITKQAVSNVTIKMKTINNKLYQAYLVNGLFGLL